MSRNYDYLLTILKTPMGFLTKDGFSQDITSKDVIVLCAYKYGNYSSIRTRVQFFVEKTDLSQKIIEELYSRAFECEVIAYKCEHTANCQVCEKFIKKECEFWNNDRGVLKLFKL